MEKPKPSVEIRTRDIDTCVNSAKACSIMSDKEGIAGVSSVLLCDACVLYIQHVTQNFDCVFWCGDLNFRLAQPREEVIQWVTDTCFPHSTPISLAKDQLRAILNEGAVLRGFQEAPITFPPTYKYDPGTQTFDSSSKQRTPAYTDRILFKGKGHTRGYIRRFSHDTANQQKDGSIECLVYDSVPSICTSDHKPVWGVFKTIIRPGIDTIPLAAGLFNREVYLEGIKRRAAAMDDSYGTSKVCSLQ